MFGVSLKRLDWFLLGPLGTRGMIASSVGIVGARTMSFFESWRKGEDVSGNVLSRLRPQTYMIIFAEWRGGRGREVKWIEQSDPIAFSWLSIKAPLRWDRIKQ